MLYFNTIIQSQQLLKAWLIFFETTSNMVTVRCFSLNPERGSPGEWYSPEIMKTVFKTQASGQELAVQEHLSNILLCIVINLKK